MEKWYSTEPVHKASGMSDDKRKERKTPGNAVEGKPESNWKTMDACGKERPIQIISGSRPTRRGCQ